MFKLTPRQQEILDFIKSTLEVLRCAAHAGGDFAGLRFRLAECRRGSSQGARQERAIVLEPGSARGIRLVEQLGLPLIGSVAAGSPLLAVENVQGRYALDAQLFSPRDYLLKVRGLSMIDAGIFDGDLLAVHKTNQARDGQIVVARLDEEVTVKRLQHQVAALSS